jgi:hypothetical protein
MLLVHDAKEGDESIRTGVLLWRWREVVPAECYQHSGGRALAGLPKR